MDDLIEIPKPPKDLAENVDYRIRLLDAAQNDTDLQKGLIDLCSRDIVFWWDTFGFTFDPRKEPSTIPMVLYEFQEEAIRSIEEAMGVRDLCISKSRDMGASWMLLGVFLWRFLFRDGQAFLLISRNEDYVDKAGNPKSLFWKIDFLMQNLPSWMYPNFTRHKLRLSNHEIVEPRLVLMSLPHSMWILGTEPLPQQEMRPCPVYSTRRPMVRPMPFTPWPTTSR